MSGIRRRCRQCTKRFEINRHWQVFCSDLCRRRWNREYGSHCFFCGVLANSRHHLHPVAARARREFDGQETVKVCQKCNSALGGEVYESVDDQFLHLLAHYKSKRAKAMPQWDEEEVKELGPALRRRIRSMLAKERQIEDRILYLGFALAHYQRQTT